MLGVIAVVSRHSFGVKLYPGIILGCVFCAAKKPFIVSIKMASPQQIIPIAEQCEWVFSSIGGHPVHSEARPQHSQVFGSDAVGGHRGKAQETLRYCFFKVAGGFCGWILS